MSTATPSPAALVNRSTSAPAPREGLDVERVFDGTRLVLLGGTGFLGKVFLAMLLERFPNIGQVFLMVRAGKGKTSDERFWSDIATSDALRSLRESHGGADAFALFLRTKVTPINGDVGRDNCGVDGALIGQLKGTVDALVNVAGVVDFNPPLDEALDANAFGSQNLVSLARALGDVPLFHTSTCYVAGLRKGPILEVDPFTYPFPRCEELGRDLWSPEREIADCLDLIAQARHRCDDAFRQSEFLEKAHKNLLSRGEPTEGKALDDELAKVRRRWVSDKLIEAGSERATHWGWPNTYTYTKSIGEQIIARSGLKFTIARPACCETTDAYPFRGWNEGISTTVPFIYLVLKGAPQLPGNESTLDLIPTDMVAVGMILALAELLEGDAKPVYQLGSSDLNPCTTYRLGELMGLYKRKSFQKRGGNPLLNYVQAHIEPSIVSIETIDRIGAPAMAKATRSLAKMLKAAPGAVGGIARPAASALEGFSAGQKKIGELLHLFAPFSTWPHGPFSCANTRAAYARLDDAWKVKLRWAPDELDWADWFYGVHMPAVEKLIVPEMDARMKREKKALAAHETLVHLVDQMAERHEHRVALSFIHEDNGETVGMTRVTFADVRDRARAVAARLAEMGVKKGDRVAIAGKNHPDWPIAFFGVLRAGATAVPVDPEIEAGPLANVLAESGASIVIADAHVEGKSGASIRAQYPRYTFVDLHAIAAAGEGLGAPDVEVFDDDIASLIYTSGTTGKPKGVRLTHKNFASLIAALAPIFPLGDRDRVLSVLPLHHTFEFTCGLLLPFSRGARVVYLGEINADRLNLGMELARPTAMVGVPALWQLIERRVRSKLEARGPVVAAAFDFATEANRKLAGALGVDAGKLLFAPVHDALGGSLRTIISGGAALPRETQEFFAGLGLQLTEGYGLTEAAPVLTVASPSARSKPGNVGKPVPGVQIKIDAPDESGVGEVLAKGPNVMAGYTDDDATSAVMADGGWLRTGDLGKLDKSGRLSIVGRIKDVIVTSTGENVYPDDIERSLGEIDGVSELAIVGVEAPRGGERVACLAVPAGIPSRDSLPPPSSLGEAVVDARAERNERAMAALRQAFSRLPYHQQPSIVHLYDAPLPRTATRKVKRNEVTDTLRRLIAATTTTSEGDAAHASVVRTAIAAVSGRPAVELTGAATLAGDLGFDSLMLTELLEALESKSRTIDPEQLQACRTVDDVEALFGAARGRDAKSQRRAAHIEGREAKSVVLPEPVQDAAKGVIGRLQDVFYGQVMKPRVSGRAFIPHNRPTIVIANHTSHLDMGFVRHALGDYGRDIVSLAAQDYFFDQGIKRAFFENFTNLRAIDRKGGVRQSLRQAGEVIGSGRTVLIFPEGTRTPTGELQDFKPLVGHLALTHGVDLLPIYLGGTYEAMPKGASVPLKREITARIGLPLAIDDLRRLTHGKTLADASREVSRLARLAIVSLKEGGLLDLRTVTDGEKAAPKKEHPLVTLFQELDAKFKPGAVERAVSFYFTLGSDELSKWTVNVSPASCEIKLGKPEGGSADCVLKTSADLFTRIVRESYVPGVAEFLSGAVKSNDVSLLETFQKAFQLN
jgi:long-chain acyl-CoA synthetase